MGVLHVKRAKGHANGIPGAVAAFVRLICGMSVHVLSNAAGPFMDPHHKTRELMTGRVVNFRALVFNITIGTYVFYII